MARRDRTRRRYTGEFAKSAKSVLAVDFIESFIEKNKEDHAHLTNVSFEVNDAVHLRMKEQR